MVNQMLVNRVRRQYRHTQALRDRFSKLVKQLKKDQFDSTKWQKLYSDTEKNNASRAKAKRKPAKKAVKKRPVKKTAKKAKKKKK